MKRLKSVIILSFLLTSINGPTFAGVGMDPTPSFFGLGSGAAANMLQPVFPEIRCYLKSDIHIGRSETTNNPFYSGLSLSMALDENTYLGPVFDYASNVGIIDSTGAIVNYNIYRIGIDARREFVTGEILGSVTKGYFCSNLSYITTNNSFDSVPPGSHAYTFKGISGNAGFGGSLKIQHVIILSEIRYQIGDVRSEINTKFPFDGPIWCLSIGYSN
ncbi:MAG: hypothetical protein WC527_01030 [Candidatus Margulisiibacteriota bacterium]